MTQQTALQLVQDECERLAAKYQLRAYVSLPSAQNKGNEWDKIAICRVMIGDDGSNIIITHEWAEHGGLHQLKTNMETAFHAVAIHSARHKMHALAVAGQR